MLTAIKSNKMIISATDAADSLKPGMLHLFFLAVLVTVVRWFEKWAPFS